MILWVVYVVGGFAGLVAVMAVIGWTLRPDHVAARSAVIPAAPAEVFAVVRDVEHVIAWRKDVKRIELLPDVDGKRSFREHSKQGVVPFVVEVDDAVARRFVTRIVDAGLPFGGAWVIDVAAEGDGARVTVTEDGFVRNPVFRFLSRTVFSLVATQEGWLRSLGARFGAQVTPAPAEPARWKP